MTCSPSCLELVDGDGNVNYKIELDDSSMTTTSAADPVTTINFELNRLRNPKTTAATQSSFTL